MITNHYTNINLNEKSIMYKAFITIVLPRNFLEDLHRAWQMVENILGWVHPTCEPRAAITYIDVCCMHRTSVLQNGERVMKNGTGIECK